MCMISLSIFCLLQKYNLKKENSAKTSISWQDIVTGFSNQNLLET